MFDFLPVMSHIKLLLIMMWNTEQKQFDTWRKRVTTGNGHQVAAERSCLFFFFSCVKGTVHPNFKPQVLFILPKSLHPKMTKHNLFYHLCCHLCFLLKRRSGTLELFLISTVICVFRFPENTEGNLEDLIPEGRKRNVFLNFSCWIVCCCFYFQSGTTMRSCSVSPCDLWNWCCCFCCSDSPPGISLVQLIPADQETRSSLRGKFDILIEALSGFIVGPYVERRRLFNRLQKPHRTQHFKGTDRIDTTEPPQRI